MIVGIHQPNYLPYLGFFDKMKKSDVFVIYDDAQFSKGDFHNRNKIRIFHGWKWLTVPVEGKKAPLNEIEIKSGEKWRFEHFRNIQDAYSKEMLDRYIDIFKGWFDYDHMLVDLNMKLIKEMMKALGIETELVMSSELGLSSRSTQRLVDIVDAVGGDTYLSGSGGHNYLDMDLFDKAGIKVQFQEFKHPVYKQVFKGFELNMSAIDAILTDNQYVFK